VRDRKHCDGGDSASRAKSWESLRADAGWTTLYRGRSALRSQRYTPHGSLELDSDSAKVGLMRRAIVFVVTILITLFTSDALAQSVVRTGDIAIRGLKPTDFPRVTKLAENVYGYEQLDPTKRGVTANNLIVVTTGGVL